MAFDTYAACVESSGGAISSVTVDPATGQITWTAEANDSASEQAEATCYDQHFRAADTAWGLQNPLSGDAYEREQLAIFETVWAPCLIENGVEFETPETFGSAEFRNLMDTASRLASQGLCQGVVPAE